MADLTPKRHLLGHVCVKTGNTDFFGYTMIGSCASDNSYKNLQNLCTSTSSPLELPVFALGDNSVYKNIFCAKCNGANNPVYWKFSAFCDKAFHHGKRYSKKQKHDVELFNKELRLEICSSAC